MKMTLISAMAITVLSSTAYGRGVYLNEEISAKTNPDPATESFCITKVHTQLPTYSTYYKGKYGGQYDCQVDFVGRGLRGEVITGSRNITYRERPMSYGGSTDFGHALEKRFGFFSTPIGTPGMGFLLNAGPAALYSGLSILSSIFAHDFTDEFVSIAPKFTSLYAAQMAACQLSALELVDMACEPDKRKIAEEVDFAIGKILEHQDLYNGMIPRKN